MGTTLDNGTYLPDEGERNCYEGLAGNWVALDNHLGSTNIHVTINDKQAWNGHVADTTIHVTSADKQAWNGHVADTTIHVTSADKQAWNGHVADSVKHVTAEDKAKWDAVTSKADASALTAHTGDTTIHVTAEDKAAWNGKADASALTAHTGDTTIHVTSADKQAWNGKQDALSQTQLDAVNSGIDSSKVQQIATNTSDISSLQSGKADDNSVVHTNRNDDVSIPLNSTSAELGVTGGSTNVTFLDKNDKKLSGLTLGNYGSSKFSYARLNIFGKDTNNNEIQDTLEYAYVSNNNNAYLRVGRDNFCSLGTASFKWKGVYAQSYYYGSNNVEFSTKFVTTDTAQTISGNKTFSSINGVEPSSLSLPSDRSARIDISSYFTNTGTGQSNSYTVPANGYIYLTLSELTNVHCFSRSSGNVTNYAQTFTKLSNSTDALYVLFPVRKNDVFVATWYTTTTVSVDGAFFIPCKGDI